MSGGIALDERMKQYEIAARTSLPRRLPVIIRLDGKAFHTYAAHCEKPFDEAMSGVMVSTAKELCNQIQGVQLAYTQSDEISLLVHNYKRFSSGAWFDNQVQKMVSVAASIAASTFTANSWRIWKKGALDEPFDELLKCIKPANFDARVFVVPENDVCNYFVWRQQDGIRNSVQMLARSLYSHKECEYKSGEQLKEMCRSAGMPWEDLHPRWQRGIVLTRGVGDSWGWVTTNDIPNFSVNRDFINSHLALEET